MPRWLLKHYFWVCLWGCFWKKLALKLVGWGRSILTSVDGYHPIGEGPNRTKRQRKSKFSLFSWAGTFIFCPQLLILRPSDSRTDTSGPPGSPACRWQIMGLLSLYNRVWANSYNKSPHKCRSLYVIRSVSRRTLTETRVWDIDVPVIFKLIQLELPCEGRVPLRTKGIPTHPHSPTPTGGKATEGPCRETEICSWR